MSESATRPSLVETAFLQLKELLRTNRFVPGSTVPETEVASTLGMSRTPVREALIKLQERGLIELVPRHGMRVLPIQYKDMKEIYEILTTIEPEVAGKLAKRKLSDKELKPLEQATIEMEKAIQKKDLFAWAIADDKYHQTLFKLHGNNRLSEYIAILHDQAHRARVITLQFRDNLDKSTIEHRENLECLRNGNVKDARDLFRAHRERAGTELLELIKKLEYVNQT